MYNMKINKYFEQKKEVESDHFNNNNSNKNRELQVILKIFVVTENVHYSKSSLIVMAIWSSRICYHQNIF